MRIAILSLLFIRIISGPLFCQSDPKVEIIDGVYYIHASFTIEASIKTVWNVLTDYGNINLFMKYISVSEIESSGEGALLVRQRSRYKLLIIIPMNTEFLLEINECYPEKIDFMDISGKDFELYKGSWHLAENNGSVSVDYSLEANPKFIDFKPTVKAVFTKMSKRMIKDLKEEIIKRTEAKK